jgi:glutathione synthase/RimK-type ligase-like ATP-grasp enzyme
MTGRPCINGVIKATDWVVAAVRWRTKGPSRISRGSFEARGRRPGRDPSTWRLSTLTDIALATCSLLPDLDDDERSLIPALAARGLAAEPRVWDDPSVGWDDVALVVVRSTWDYSERRDSFLAWARAVPRVLNSVAVLTWNTDKAYLRVLEAAGIAVVPTTWLGTSARGAQVDLPEGALVVKPSISSGAQNTSRYLASDRDAARAHVERLVSEGRDVMVQPYVTSVDADGETGLIYFDGTFSHAIRKGPLLRAPGVATDQLWALEDITPRAPDDVERGIAESALDALPWPRQELLYARVDVVRDAGGTPMLLELELAEPSLFLGLGSGAADRLAEAIARRVGHG